MTDQALPFADLEKIRYESGAAVLIFADDQGRRDRLTDLIVGAGGRVSVAGPLDQACQRIEDHAAPDGVICDIAHADETAAIQALETMARGAAARRFHGLALIGHDQIDLAAAIAGQTDVALLCEPEPADITYAIGGILHRDGIRLNDISAEAAPLQLRQLSEEVGRIAKTLASLSHTSELTLVRQDDRDAQPDDPVVEAPMIRAMIRARRLRAQFFHPDLFADPAWDMLLDLSAARLEEQPVPVSSLCIAAAVPATTALRYIGKMTEFGLLTRIADPHDRRRAFVGLAEDTADAMTRCLSAILRMSRAVA